MIEWYRIFLDSNVDLLREIKLLCPKIFLRGNERGFLLLDFSEV